MDDPLSLPPWLPLTPWLLLAGAAVVLGLALFSNLTCWVGGRFFLRRGDLVQRLAEVTGLQRRYVPAGLFSGIDGLRLHGKLPGGREAKVCLYAKDVGDEESRHLRYFASWTVATDAVPRLRVTQETFFTKVAKALGKVDEVEVGDEAFDRRFLLEAEDKPRARKALGSELRDAIVRAFDLGARELTIGGNAIEVEAPLRSVSPDDYGRMLEALEDASRTLDRKKLAVRVLGGERSALVDATGRTRCPYCHGGITGDEEDLVACEKCATVLHDGCWVENGGCPLLGCTGRAPERARTHGR